MRGQMAYWTVGSIHEDAAAALASHGDTPSQEALQLYVKA